MYLSTVAVALITVVITSFPKIKGATHKKSLALVVHEGPICFKAEYNHLPLLF